ncbi:MAG: isoleucine--tRNA ligase [Phycisphaerales bacterium JB037]
MSESTSQPAREASAKEGKSPYRKTLNLPSTDFPMKANLVQREPESQKRWEQAGLYEKLRGARADSERFVFHDGPPYANGSIHLGHLLNKCLKDFIVRSQGMLGRNCPFVPGWDCHGLPIEHKVMTELVESGKIKKLLDLDDTTRHLAIRRECTKYAEKYQRLQAGQMQRLLTLADYEHPYLTMQPDYEAAVLEVLADLVEQGLVYRALKPVHWSIANQTALAEAELEYQDREDISVFVDFEAESADAVYDAFGLDVDARPGAKPSFMIWTTTPWTLPANMAVAVNERFEYALVRVDGNCTVLAAELVEKVTRAAKAEDVEVLATARGSNLLGLRYKHPFRAEPAALSGDLSKIWSIVSAEYVTLEDGTGLVHTATGHGAEDYQTGLREGMPIYCPVRGDGTYDETAPEWLRGKSVWEANELVTEHLRSSGHLFHDNKFMHSYPHDWRSKTPVIFRATEQWFVGVETPMKRDGRTLRGASLEDIEKVEFVPAWGKNRMRGMLESRPDWCISRQRSWGLPIPAFFDAEGRVLMTPASVRAVAAVVREKGSDAWFQSEPAELLTGYDPSKDADAPMELKVGTLTKGFDILDVWFESGSSWNAVMRQRSGGADFPVQVYVEGSDQHRGWFQTSLLPSLASMGTPPFRQIVTHGFMVDRDGHKLSKSKGHTIENLFEKYGADVLRWWVSSLNYENEMKVDDELFQLAGESYRKVRNTLRFLLSNLGDFDPAQDPGALAALDPRSLEAWVIGEVNRVQRECVAAFGRFNFQRVHKLLFDLCNDTLSAVYLAAVKDRLYCDAPDSIRRRATQRTLRAITESLATLAAPILCHTADEAYRSLHGGNPDACVHLETIEPIAAPEPHADWAKVFLLRQQALRAFEQAKSALGVENPLDAEIVFPDADGVLAAFAHDDLADLLGVSRVSFGSAEIEVRDLRDQPRCERSWKRTPDVRERSDGGMLTDRDAAALGLA